MIERYLLRYFLAVIDRGNFSRAAEACHVTQPTLSAGIARLERDLGRPLFTRTNRRVELTAAGARLAAHARAIEARFAAAEREVEAEPRASTIRLGWLVTLAPDWTARYLAALPRAGERVEIVEGRERDLLDGLARGRLDAALTLLRGGERFAARPLLTERYGVALAERHPLADRAEIAAEDLAGEPMIVRRQCEILSDTSRFFTARGVRPFFPARTVQEAQALAYVRAGLGVTVMPESFAAPGIRIRPLAEFGFARTIGILRAPGRAAAESPAIAALAAAPDPSTHQESPRP